MYLKGSEKLVHIDEPTGPTVHDNVTPLFGTGQPAPRFGFSSISVVFPAYNEKDNIERAVAQAREAASKYFRDVEIIVVNDGSEDGTREILRALADEHPDVVAIDHPTNRGYGAALSSGIYRATKDLIFFTDSDLQFDLHEIEKLLHWVDSYDIVVGYRVDRADNFMRRFNAFGWNKLVQLVLGVKLRDIDCAFKVFRREVFDEIRIDSVGAMVNTEIFLLAQQLKVSVKEVPVSHFPREAGEQSGANLRVILKAFQELWRMHRQMKGRARRAPRRSRYASGMLSAAPASTRVPESRGQISG